MLPNKIELTDTLISKISEKRKSTGISAYDVSESIGKSKYWLPNIESGKSKTISKEDIILLFMKFENLPTDKTEEFIEKLLSDNDNTSESNEDMLIFKPNNTDLETQKELYDKYVENIVEGFNVFYNKIDNKKDAIDMIRQLNHNMHRNMGYTMSVASLPLCKLRYVDVNLKREIFDNFANAILEHGKSCTNEDDTETECNN